MVIYNRYTLWRTNKKQWKMAIEIVDFPSKNGDFPWQNVSSPEGTGGEIIELNLNARLVMTRLASRSRDERSLASLADLVLR